MERYHFSLILRDRKRTLDILLEVSTIETFAISFGKAHRLHYGKTAIYSILHSLHHPARIHRHYHHTVRTNAEWG